ncbi:MAG: hypothetical protein L3J24_03005 [Xanthomonadales bacterium]|nr:hypothetical protein [Xanthomonadales bacterium]
MKNTIVFLILGITGLYSPNSMSSSDFSFGCGVEQSNFTAAQAYATANPNNMGAQTAASNAAAVYMACLDSQNAVIWGQE